MTFEEYWWIGVCANPNMARDTLLKQIAESAWNAGAKDEREACARLCEEGAELCDAEWANKRPDEAAELDAVSLTKIICASKIRMRSNVEVQRDAQALLRGSAGTTG